MNKRSQPLLADGQPLRGRARKRRDPAQPNLPLDPMPDRVEPALALLKPRPPGDPRFIAEVKFDGYGAIHVEPGGVRFLTRAATSAILDGEAVVLDKPGRSTSAHCSVRWAAGEEGWPRATPSSTPST